MDITNCEWLYSTISVKMQQTILLHLILNAHECQEIMHRYNEELVYKIWKTSTGQKDNVCKALIEAIFMRKLGNQVHTRLRHTFKTSSKLHI